MENKDLNPQDNNADNDRPNNQQPIQQNQELSNDTVPTSPTPETNIYPQPQVPNYTSPQGSVTDPAQVINQAPNNIYQTTESPQLLNDKHVNSPGLITLQWLTYAFWGWTAIAILWIAITVTTYYINSSDVLGIIPYSIAAILVLLPISIVCDLFYMKKEPIKKTGAASVIMIIHAVIFALFGVGSLVTIVLNLVTILIDGNRAITQTFLICAGIMFVVYAALFIRTIVPGKRPTLRRLIIAFISIISAALIALSIIGPIANISLTKNDKLIAENISSISTGIDNYVSLNNKLPNSLNDLNNLQDDSKILITDNLVTYKKEGLYETKYETGSNHTKSATYKYQLCVNYKKADSANSSYSSSYSSINNGGYDSYISTYGHPAGEVCYKLITK